MPVTGLGFVLNFSDSSARGIAKETTRFAVYQKSNFISMEFPGSNLGYILNG